MREDRAAITADGMSATAGGAGHHPSPHFFPLSPIRQQAQLVKQGEYFGRRLVDDAADERKRRCKVQLSVLCLLIMHPCGPPVPTGPAHSRATPDHSAAALRHAAHCRHHIEGSGAVQACAWLG